MHLASLQVAVVLSAVTVLSRPVLATAPKEALFGWQGDTFREAEAFGDRCNFFGGGSIARWNVVPVDRGCH